MNEKPENVNVGRLERVLSLIETMPKERAHTSVPCDDLRLLAGEVRQGQADRKREPEALTVGYGVLNIRPGDQLLRDNGDGTLTLSVRSLQGPVWMVWAERVMTAVRQALEETSKNDEARPEMGSEPGSAATRERGQTTEG